MHILVMWPLHVPSYFNAGHHLPVFQVANYLRKLEFVTSVKAVDAGALNLTWKDFCDLLQQNPVDVIAVMNDFDAVDSIERTLHYIKVLLPKAKIITFGRLSKQTPEFFCRFPIDAIVHSGDYESGVEAYLESLSNRTDKLLPGVLVLREGEWEHEREHGIYLEPNRWVLPDISEIPYAAYMNLYKRDENKFCGIPERKELVIPVARGCPVQCEYCDVPKLQGLKERRLSVERVVQYIKDSFENDNFEYVSMYAPTFTLNKKWVIEFCEALKAEKNRYPWKCVSTLYHLNEDLIKLMKESGCVRISIGLETLDPSASSSLPKIKQDTEQKFVQVAELCRKLGVELNCFVILGLPGETIEGAKYTIEKVGTSGARVRPTVYTPYHLIRSDMSIEEVSSFNRQFFVDGLVSEEEARGYYALFFAEELSPTQVMMNIPIREGVK